MRACLWALAALWAALAAVRYIDGSDWRLTATSAAAAIGWAMAAAGRRGRKEPARGDPPGG